MTMPNLPQPAASTDTARARALTGPESAAVYVHYPWCLHRCSYCDFATTAHHDPPRAQYTDAVLTELALRTRGWRPKRVTSVFFGGGTPSLWGPAEISRVLEAIDRWSPLTPTAEISLEANPGALESGDLGAYATAGVNRVSVGVQATDDARLRALDRLHDAAAARSTLAELGALLAQGRLRSASADLLFGAPGQDLDALRSDLATLLDAGLPHLSAYSLTVESGTPLGQMVERGLATAPDEGLQADMLEALPELVAPWGLSRYEVSNFAVDGHACAHNLVYWQGGYYLALGTGAHGFVPDLRAPPGGLAPDLSRPHGHAPWRGQRYGNHRSSARYLLDLGAGRLSEALSEVVDPDTHRDELVLTGLRLRDGVDVDPWRHRLGDARVDALLARADTLATRGAPIARVGSNLRVLTAGVRHLDRHILALLDDLPAA